MSFADVHVPLSSTPTNIPKTQLDGCYGIARRRLRPDILRLQAEDPLRTLEVPLRAQEEREQLQDMHARPEEVSSWAPEVPVSGLRERTS